jgi:uncharacterized protein
MTTHEFEIPARDLDAAGKSYSFTVRAAWLRGILEGIEATIAGPDGLLELRASKSGTDVVVHGTLKAELTSPCARCLAPTDVRVAQQLSALYVPAKSIKGSTGLDNEYEFEPEEADMLPFDGDTVILDDFVRDELLLEIPMIPLCSEDCPGMSPNPDAGFANAGALERASEDDEANIDPRLLPLLRLKKQTDRKKE